MVLLWLVGPGLSFAAGAEISVLDDTGRPLKLTAPAHRIVSLAPHVTELLYATGAGHFIVGAVEYSDYPKAAKNIPRVGSGAGLDVEAIVALHPDLVVAWRSGNPSWQMDRLIGLGIPVFLTEPRHLDDIAGLLEKLGELAGTGAAGSKAATDFRRRLAQLRSRYSGQPAVSVFYQILDNSLLTVSGRHIISDVIQLCGGRNVYAALPGLVPRVDIEAVLKENPEAILASGDEALWPEWRNRWRAMPMLSASMHENIFLIPPDLIHRHSPRILDGAERVCAALEQARSKRKISGDR